MSTFSDHRARIRSDDTVEREVDAVRQWSRLHGRVQFDVTNLIDGPLRKNLPFGLDISFNNRDLDYTPSFVKFFGLSDQATLYVRKSVWNLAKAKHALSRFILAHEIGHLKMHRADVFAFSDTSKSVLSKLQEEERVEPQANKFADRLLVEESLLIGYTAADEIAYIFNVPMRCAIRRFEYITDKIRRKIDSGSNAFCTECGNLTATCSDKNARCPICGA